MPGRRRKNHQYGCLSCGVIFHQYAVARGHMSDCCPEKLDLPAVLAKSQLRHHKCEVPGYKRFETGLADDEDAARPQTQQNTNDSRKATFAEKISARSTGSSTASLSPKVLACPPRSPERLRAAIESTLDEMHIPYGMQSAIGSNADWVAWGTKLAEHPERTCFVKGEYEKDVQLHSEYLDGLAKEKGWGNAGSYDYILAHDCMFQHTFIRCHLPLPPPLAMNGMTGLSAFEEPRTPRSSLQAWRIYNMRALMVVEAVNANRLDNVPIYILPDIIPATKRLPMNLTAQYGVQH